MISFPNAKINLGLFIVEKRKDGYHNIETIFYPVKLSDALEINKSESFKITTTGIDIQTNAIDNIVTKAYNLLKRDFNLSPVHIHLHKAIPHGAGLGGGSSDAAFTLRLLNDLFELNLNLKELENYAAILGADCCFFLYDSPKIAYGIGDILNPINLSLSDYTIIIIKPPFSINTKEAYSNIMPKPAPFDLKKLPGIPLDQWKNYLSNDFEEYCIKIFPQIKKIKKLLYDQGAVYSGLSGSGSAIFGIFKHSPTDFSHLLPTGYFFYR